VCYGNELSRCPVEHVVNAYDNSIRYTDHNLAQQIDMLSAVSATIDSILIYVSDHGESLGEKGLYLHGAPFLLAPEQQINVPLLVWMSDGYRRRFAVSDACLRARKAERFSHDNLYHTVLGASGVTSARYQSALDMFAECRSAP
jgi:lipid A ethanolaminephosphotransferase